ncbi:hypothetical protein Lal_00019157 [Lupinus albus]|uniref:Uncharacterized protein n=1 Tax=Lupinus albus TaxID=3870 RepID=A0A6A4R537_LUPAL|nr:hypothetical protein Lalb_Chr01g0009961 [Lupinus albus]KAF1899036.1 hypothetical protein Lal_00019157 [Lupinus albus]
MGGVCSRSTKATIDGVAVDKAISESARRGNGHSNNESGMAYQNLNGNSPLPPVDNDTDRKEQESFSSPGMEKVSYRLSGGDINDGIPILSKASLHKSRSTKSKQAALLKVSEMSSLFGRAGSVGLGKAVDVLDTLGSSMTNFNLSSGFTSGVTTKGNKISILAFEVANTIVKGVNLMQSLSKENITHLKEVVLPSEGVQTLISSDMNELLRIAAEDKREELKIFSGEVVRFGNRCKDPQWHNLDRYFQKLGSELTPQKHLKEEAQMVMQQLMTLVLYTAELYHELHALDRFDQDYRRKLQEEDNTSATQTGDSIAILRAELKIQNKHVRNLKKKSLWSKILEQVIEKLVEVVHFLHLEIHEAFGIADNVKGAKYSQGNHKTLGSAGLALHYANIINQLDTLVSRSSSVPPNTRDALYHGLPPNVRTTLRSKLKSFQVKEELTVPQIKAEMEKTLQWLVPIAANTTKAHHGFGWVGEWANTGSEMNHKPGLTGLLRIETLHHADKDKTEAYILELVVWLHHLVSQTRVTNGGIRSVRSPICSPNDKTGPLLAQKACSTSPTLTVEDQQMLLDVGKRKLTPGISKSQEFDTAKYRLSKHHRLCKSSNHSPISETKNEIFYTRRSSIPVIDFDIDRMKALDVIDRVDSIGSS